MQLRSMQDRRMNAIQILIEKLYEEHAIQRAHKQNIDDIFQILNKKNSPNPL